MDAKNRGAKWFLLHVVLNLPERDHDAGRPTKHAEVRTPPSDPEVSGNPWLTAAETTAPPADLRPSGATRPPTTPEGGEVPWRIEDEGKAWRLWRRALRIVGIVAVCLFAWIGFRVTFLDRAEPAPAPTTPPAELYDTEAAQGVAARAITSAMTWNQDAPDAHATAIALDYVNAGNGGWNGKGRQVVTQAIPTTVDVDPAGHSAIVSVYANITVYTEDTTGKDDKPTWTVASNGWQTYAVTIAEGDGRLVATGPPVLIGTPTPAYTPPPADTALEDSTLSGETTATATAFFTAYGDGDVSAVEAPGSNVAAPNSPWRFAKLTAWHVNTGTGPTRDAVATVQWTIPNTDTTLTQTYDVTVTQVTSPDGGAWHISAIAPH